MVTDPGAHSGGNVGVIEILNRSGQVLQRVPYRGGALSIGRAYDNDVIVGDPYVCPHHLLLEERAGVLSLSDRGSFNGSYLSGIRGRFDRIELQDRSRVQFGHSQLRYRKAGGTVAPAWRDISRKGLLAWFDKPFGLVAGVVLALLALIMDSLLESTHQPGVGELAGELFYPLIGLFLWSGLWSLVNRITSHRANFHVHLSIACIGIAALFLAAQAIGIVGFALAWDPAAPLMHVAGQVAVLTLTIYAHLRYATHGRPVAQAVTGLLTAVLLFGTPAIGEYFEKSEFDTIPWLEPLLKPPVFQWKAGVDVEEFFDDAAVLKERLDREAAESDG
jgi:hypothetical protein